MPFPAISATRARSFSLSLFFSSRPHLRHPSSQPCAGVGWGREFTGRSKSFARKAKTLANGCFSWAEYLKKGGGGGGGEERGGRKSGAGRREGVGRRKRETAEIKTRELLASLLVSRALSLSRVRFFPLFSLFSLSFFLSLLRSVSAAETKKCNLPLLGDTLPRVQTPTPRLSPPREGDER